METSLSFALASLLLVTAWFSLPRPSHCDLQVAVNKVAMARAPTAYDERPHENHYHHARGTGKHHYASKHECRLRCEEHCKKGHPEKEKEKVGKCVKECSACCCGSKRVREDPKQCKWNQMRMEGNNMKCP